MEENKIETKVEIKPEQNILDKMNDLLNLNDVADLIKSNEKEFEIEGVTYRAKKPSFKQRQEAYKKKIEKYTELLKDEKYLLEKDLKELYRKRGVDIDEMSRELENKIRKRDEFMIKLGEEIKNNAIDSTLKLLKKEIEELNLEIQELSIKKTMLLESSIEQQINIFIYTYFTFLLGEKKEGENWVRVWNTYEEYENGKQEVINRFSYYITFLLGNEL